MSAQVTDPADLFEQVKSLAGKWSGINEDGELVKIDYRLSANASIVVETWDFANGMEALTIYHMDGQDLMAAHYCPIGNQPMLKLTTPAAMPHLKFAFESARNIKGPEQGYEQAFELMLKPDGKLWRSETYMENGMPDTNATLFSRLRN